VSKLVAPQLVISSRMLYLTWIPADSEAVGKLVDPRLGRIANGQCFINQYVVDKAEQTSGFGAYSLTYAGADLDRFAPDGQTPSRWWTHYLNSSAGVREYTAERGVPASAGETALELSGDTLVATTRQEGVDLIRTTVRVGSAGDVVAAGQLSYITDIDGKLVDGLYPFIAPLVDPWEVLDFEFLAPDHSIHALRPASPLQVTWGFYSPAASFCYPGGETIIG
jgi:hypothetical protein